MARITLTIPDEKLNLAIKAIKHLWPIPTQGRNGPPLFTDSEWAKEAIRRIVIQAIERYKLDLAIAQARESLTPEEEDIVT